jgi:hypothetical protein
MMLAFQSAAAFGRNRSLKNKFPGKQFPVTGQNSTSGHAPSVNHVQ